MAGFRPWAVITSDVAPADQRGTPCTAMSLSAIARTEHFQGPRLELCTSLHRLMRTDGFLCNQPHFAASLIWSPGGIFQ